jgi:hypothetical protein
MYRNCKISFVYIFSIKLLNNYVRGNEFGEVVHNELCIDFLANKLHLF